MPNFFMRFRRVDAGNPKISAAAPLPAAADKNAIRPFHVNVPEAEPTEMRRRVNATKCLNGKRSWMYRKECS